MLFANMVERTDDPALENGEIVFSAIDVNEAAQAHIFVGRMTYGSVSIKFLAELRVSGVFVGSQI